MSPWVIPAPLLVPVEAYGSKRYRSALVGTIVHSMQSVFLFGVVLSLVLKGRTGAGSRATNGRPTGGPFCP
jgi:hypothetical protein